MPVIVNRNTAQQPMLNQGRTGSQSVRFIDAPRVYIKTADPKVNTPVQNYTSKSNGITPVGWTDLGIVNTKVKTTYNKKTKDIRTGIDNVLRAQYSNEKDCSIEFMLEQMDDFVLETISGLGASIITAGSTVQYGVGQEDVNQLALLMVSQNKLDGKEWQFYNPAAYLNFSFDEGSDMLSLKVTGTLPFFQAVGQTNEEVLRITINA